MSLALIWKEGFFNFSKLVTQYGKNLLFVKSIFKHFQVKRNNVQNSIEWICQVT
jgi:hypothetical protein